MKKCLFCDNKLDNSDEHIIPESINGRLHSKQLICHTCNSKKFGTIIDPELKRIFNPLMLTLGFKNANSIQVNDLEGRKYIHSRDGKTTPIRPERTISAKDGKLIISVEGDKKNALKLMEKTKEVLFGINMVEYDLFTEEINYSGIPYSFEYKIEITSKLLLEINKIALEYYAYNNFELKYVKHLIDRLYELDETINNVIFCNWDNEVRSANFNEISHLIVIKSNNKSKILYAYIELFNVVCAYIMLNDNYSGPYIDSDYHQDVISGKVLHDKISITFDEPPINKNNIEDFSILLENMYSRLTNISFEKSINPIVPQIRLQLDNEVRSKKLSSEQYDEELIKRTCEEVVKLSFYKFPYLIEDNKEEENDHYNYFHSNMKEERYEEFCDLNKGLYGLNVTFPNNEVYVFDSFVKRPFLKRNSVTLVKVYCILINNNTKRRIYIPFRKFFSGINSKA